MKPGYPRVVAITLGSDPTRHAVQETLARLGAGQSVADAERQVIDLKEEAGRRDKSGQIEPGSPRSDAVVEHLTPAAICMANTPGGGALIVGVADDGALIGAVTDDGATWHAKRMAQLNYDWSADESTIKSDAARPSAIMVARDFLLDSGDPSAADLANAPDAEILRRLNAVTGRGMLTNAGVLAFVGRAIRPWTPRFSLSKRPPRRWR
jgi:ATP-dependent DNA helicase RecG